MEGNSVEWRETFEEEQHRGNRAKENKEKWRGCVILREISRSPSVVVVVVVVVAGWRGPSVAVVGGRSCCAV